MAYAIEHASTPTDLSSLARGRGAGSRLVAGGVSVLVALALVVNLTCGAATAMPSLPRQGSTEKLPLRQLTLAIHRVVRRLIRSRTQREQPRAELHRHRTNHRPVRHCTRPIACLAAVPCRMLAHLIDLPPPAVA